MYLKEKRRQPELTTLGFSGGGINSTDAAVRANAGTVVPFLREGRARSSGRSPAAVAGSCYHPESSGTVAGSTESSGTYQKPADTGDGWERSCNAPHAARVRH